MAKIKSDITVSEKLYENIRRIIQQARKKVYRTINFAMVEAYWNIGRLIVENEQKGKRRAEYGTALIKKLSGKLSSEFGKGYDESNLKRMRQFYLTFPPIQNLSPKNGKGAAPITIPIVAGGIKLDPLQIVNQGGRPQSPVLVFK